MQLNIIYEYQTLNKENHKELILHIKKTKALQKYFKRDFEGLKAQQYCGIINLNKIDYYILPKIANNNDKTNLNIFTYMFCYANNIKIHNDDIANSLNFQTNNILELFIQLFIKKLFKELKKGTHKEYITKEDNLRVLKGKYLINENIKYNFTKDKIFCKFDEFSIDNKLNQFFLYAIKTLIKYTKNKSLLKKCELIFDEVSFRQFDIYKIKIPFNRLNSRFKDSFELAILLLKKSIPMFDNGKKSFAFLFDMNYLFEGFIGEICKSIDNTTKLQNNEKFGDLSLTPDIITSTHIIDTKYKKEDLKTNDKYQMFVYGINFGIYDTILLYPKHNNNLNDSKPLILGNDDKIVELKTRSIDLDFDGGYDGYIEIIKNRTREI